MVTEEVERLWTAAAGLTRVADEIETRLDAVLERLGPPIWAGRAADAAAAAGEAARADLSVAAGSLRELGGELSLAAGLLRWRSEEIGVGAAPPDSAWSGPRRSGGVG